ncbi:MAG: DNA-binding response regulator [Calditrichaeota bacterium]|nr:MAG: DNA-binding response regulator [Calditrichota bacterium]
MAIRVIIADDHPIFREGLIRVLSDASDFELIGSAKDGAQAYELICDRKPDIVVLDISMPKMNGLEILKKIRQNKPPVKCVILTMYRDEEYFNEAMDLGVRGYLLKENAVSEFIHCLRKVSQDRYFISSEISEYLVNRNENLKTLQKEHPALQKLTSMERRILKLVAENKTSQEISQELFISYRTVQNHRNNICNKLGFKGHNKLLQFALEHKSLL